MNKFLFPIYAVILGVLIAKLSKSSKTWNTKLLLAFSGAFLLALTLFDLLPDVYEEVLNTKITGLLIMCGILLQIILEFFSRGAEHGHVHLNKQNNAFPWLLFVSLCIHSLLEGFPIHQHNDMVYGVLIHKIPIAALLAMYLFESNYNKGQIILFLITFAAMTPIGTFISNEVDWVADYVVYINAIVIGIFFHISTTILFETGDGHKFNLSKLLAIIIGVTVAYLF